MAIRNVADFVIARIRSSFPDRRPGLSEQAAAARNEIRASFLEWKADPDLHCSSVGVAGFEPTTSSSRTKRATKLRYTPRRAGQY
jgi:hypothetical protein